MSERDELVQFSPAEGPRTLALSVDGFGVEREGTERGSPRPGSRMLSQILSLALAVTPTFETRGAGSVTLAWHAPGGCSTAEMLAVALAAEARRSASNERLVVDARVVRRHRRHWTLQLRLTAGRDGPPIVAEAPTCAELEEVVRTHIVARLQVYAVHPAPVVRAPRPIRWNLRLGLAGRAGLLRARDPTRLAGGQLTLGIGRRRLLLELGASFATGRGAWDGRSFLVRMATGVARGCVVSGVPRLEVPLCLGVEAGGLREPGRESHRPGSIVSPQLSGALHWRPHALLGLLLQGHVGPAFTRFAAASPDLALSSDRPVKLLVGLSLGLTIFLEPVTSSRASGKQGKSPR